MGCIVGLRVLYVGEASMSMLTVRCRIESYVMRDSFSLHGCPLKQSERILQRAYAENVVWDG